MANFNRIASFYDFLKQLIFKDHLDNASAYFVKNIPTNATVLIIGGGSGKILSSLKPGHKVSYVDASDKMIYLAKKRKSEAEVEFFTNDIMQYKSNTTYDVVITPFFLDCFSENYLEAVFSPINQMLKKGGLWLHSDFYPQNKKQQLLVQFMYFNFRLSTGLKVNKIPDFDNLFISTHFFQQKKAVFRNAMVHSYIYKKIA